MRVSLPRARKSCETVTVLSRATVSFILKKIEEGGGGGGGAYRRYAKMADILISFCLH